MEWNEESIARLRALWAEGLSTAEIGRRLNVSKNAVVGKAHRLNLSPRPSPIRRAAEGSAPARRIAPRRPQGSTLPPLPEAPPAPPPAPAPFSMTAGPPLVRPPVAAPRPVQAAPLREAPRPAPSLRSVPPSTGGRVTTCCWPIGEPGTKSFRFCDDASTPGKPYCAQHAALAYVKVRDRREEAAA